MRHYAKIREDQDCLPYMLWEARRPVEENELHIDKLKRLEFEYIVFGGCGLNFGSEYNTVIFNEETGLLFINSLDLEFIDEKEEENA